LHASLPRPCRGLYARLALYGQKERRVVLAVEAEDTSSFSDELTERVRQAIPVLLEVIDEEFEG